MTNEVMFPEYPRPYEIEIRLLEHYQRNIRLGAAHLNPKTFAVMFEVLIDNISTKKYINLERCLDAFSANSNMNIFYKTLFDQIDPIHEEWKQKPIGTSKETMDMLEKNALEIIGTLDENATR